MHAIIIGGGRIGLTFAEELAKEKCDVVIVENDKERCEEIAQHVNAKIIHGDGANPEILEEAGIEMADVMASLTSKEEVNLMACLMAKNMKNCKTVARIKNPKYREIFKQLGIDIVLFPEVTAAEFLAEIITKPEVVDLAFIKRGDASILEFDVSKGSQVVDMNIHELEYPKGSLIIAIYENGKLIIPDASTKLGVGDKVLVIAKNDMIEKIRAMFGNA